MIYLLKLNSTDQKQPSNLCFKINRAYLSGFNLQSGRHMISLFKIKIPCVGKDTDPLLLWKGWDHMIILAQLYNIYFLKQQHDLWLLFQQQKQFVSAFKAGAQVRTSVCLLLMG